MSEKRFEVAFSGEVREGADVAEVKRQVATLFKAPVAKIEPLFSGQRFVIKKGLDETTALKYQAALLKAGACAEVVDTATGQARPARPAPAPTPVPKPQVDEPAPTAADGTLTMAEPGVQIVEPETVVDLEVDVTAYQMDQPGVQLVEPEPFQELQVDVSALQMDEPGVQLVEPEPVAELEVDLGGMSMDEPGVQLVEPEPVEALQVDLAGMSMAEPGTRLAEPEPIPDADIDTGALKLDD